MPEDTERSGGKAPEVGGLAPSSDPSNSHLFIRLQIAELLRNGGWNVAAFPEARVVRNPPRPSFLAISPPADGHSPARIQVYIRRPDRSGRLGAGNLRHVVEASQVFEFLPVVVSDRGFTPYAQLVARQCQPEMLLCSPEGALEYIRTLAPAVSVLAADDGIACRAEVAISGAVTADLLAELAASRNRLEQVLRTCSPRFLEELVAANWEREGFEVQIVRRINAGGPDVIATKKDYPIPFKVLTSVKWRSGERAIKRLDVSELLAWVEQVYPVNAGVLATNSMLQSGAIELVQRFHRIASMDRHDLLAWTTRLWTRTA